MADDVMEKMDITEIHHADETFDVIYCSHVLEHVPDDRRAMQEFYRVLKYGGWAILNVPISASQTVENPSITDPQERLRLFGQVDHVRRYGPDYLDRVEEAGFKIRRITTADLVTSKEAEMCGLSNGAVGDVFYCTKEAST